VNLESGPGSGHPARVSVMTRAPLRESRGAPPPPGSTGLLAPLRARITGGRVLLDPPDVAAAGLALCGAALLLPEVPGYPGIACPLRAATGVPCPLCGLTTSMRALFSFDLATSLALNPLGAVAVLVTGAALLGLRRAVSVPAALVGAVLIASWAYQLLRYSVV
jgi:Protein of unknown function (DUF2752)